jgi:hypothetical protein
MLLGSSNAKTAVAVVLLVGLMAMTQPAHCAQQQQQRRQGLHDSSAADHTCSAARSPDEVAAPLTPRVGKRRAHHNPAEPSHTTLPPYTPTARQAYEQLVSKLRELDALNGISGLLGWDELVRHVAAAWCSCCGFTPSSSC